MSFKMVHGEAMSADDSAIASKLPELRATISSYHPDDVWNADEFDLFFGQALGWTLSQKDRVPSGHKKTRCVLLFLLLATPEGKRRCRS